MTPESEGTGFYSILCAIVIVFKAHNFWSDTFLSLFRNTEKNDWIVIETLRNLDQNR